jgi:hypothetical protein
MKSWNSIKKCGATVAAVLLVAAQAQAIVAYNFPATPDSTSASGTLALGNIFQVNSIPGLNQALVTRIGVADYGAPGFSGNVPVAIYSWSGSQWNTVAGTSHVFSGTPGSLEGGTAFYTLPTAVILNAGVYAVMAANLGANNPYWDASQLPHNNINQAATFGGGPYLTMGAVFSGVPDRGLVVLNQSALPPSFGGGIKVDYGSGLFGAPGTPSFAGATFDFTPVPEATAFGAAAIGLLGLVYIGRYARLRRTATLS